MTGAMVASSIIPNLGFGQTTALPSNISHPMYGLNYFVPAHNPDFATDKNLYGSGDVNKDGIVNEADHTYSLTQPVSFAPFNDGTHRADINLNGQSFDSEDKIMLREKLDGIRTHLNMWELETKEEQENHLRKALAIDPTNKILGQANWICTNFSSQTFINFNGVYEINNSIFAENNNTTLQYDLSHNGIFRIPVRKLATRAKNGVAHSINFVYISDKNNENVKDLNKKIKIEPQSDEMFYENDNFSMDPNEFANEMHYGYFNNFFDNTYAGIYLCTYTLNNGQGTISNPNSTTLSMMPLSWNPFDDTGVEGKFVKYPADKSYEYSSEIENLVETGEVTDLLYPNETQIKKTSSNNKNSDPSKKEYYNFDVNVLYELTAGAYNPQNTPSALHNQKISVRDTEKPIYNSTTQTFSDSSGSPVVVTTRKDTTNQSCDGLVGKANEYKKGTDVSGNFLEVLTQEENFDGRIMPVYVSSPGEVEYLGNPNESNPTPNETGAPVWSHPSSNVIVHYSDQTTRESYGEKDIKRTFYGTTERSDCEYSTDTTQVIKIRSGVGVEDLTEIPIFNIYPNPANEMIRISWDGFPPQAGRHPITLSVIDLRGRVVFTQIINQAEIEVNVSNYPAGVYLIKIQDRQNIILQQKIVIQ